MWIKKTNEDLTKEKTKGRFSLTVPLLVFFLGILFLVYTDITGQKGGGNLPGRSLSWTEIYYHLPHLILLSFYFALAAFAIQLFIMNRGILNETPNSKLCLKCGKVLSPSLSKCDCGGDLDNLKNYKWVD